MVASGSATSGGSPCARPVGPTIMVRPSPANRKGQPEPSRPQAASSTRLSGLLRIARPRHWVKNLSSSPPPPPPAPCRTAPWPPTPRGRSGSSAWPRRAPTSSTTPSTSRRTGITLSNASAPWPPGSYPDPLAAAVGVVFMALAIGLAWWLAGSHLALVIAVYVAVTTAYSVRLKHEPVVDLACVSGGFVLRAIAGGVATGVPLSDWFIIVSSFGSLLIVTGKRSAEHGELGELRGAHRPRSTPTPRHSCAPCACWRRR